jgi:hypothetical protein
LWELTDKGVRGEPGEVFHKVAIYWSALGRSMGGTMGNESRDRPNSFVRATRALQENVTRSGPVAGAAYSLIGAILLLGGGGYLLDGKLGTKPWLAFAGLLLGIVVGFYELIKATRPR